MFSSFICVAEGVNLTPFYCHIIFHYPTTAPVLSIFEVWITCSRHSFILSPSCHHGSCNRRFERPVGWSHLSRKDPLSKQGSCNWCHLHSVTRKEHWSVGQGLKGRGLWVVVPWWDPAACDWGEELPLGHGPESCCDLSERQGSIPGAGAAPATGMGHGAAWAPGRLEVTEPFFLSPLLGWWRQHLLHAWDCTI
jgi:hypothetical protein